MDVPQGHPHGIDPRAFLKEVRPLIKKKPIEELLDLGGLKFQLALNVQLQKESPDGSEEFTDPVLRHKQEALLQASEMKEALDKAIPTSWSCSKSGHREGRGGWSTVQTSWTSLDTSHCVGGGGGEGGLIPPPASMAGGQEGGGQHEE